MSPFLRRRPRVLPRPRTGVVYLLVAIALFALLPLLTLVVHTGLKTLTRRQMQTAVDTAALEALRHRDATSVDGFTAAQGVVRNQFDDDFDASSVDPLRLGAGPIVEFSGGTSLGGSNFQASATVSLPDPPVWKPDLELNGDNDTSGDIVAGNHVANTAGNLGHHHENSDYSRSDFTPVTAQQRSDGEYDGILVRLRRSTESPINGVASAGPPLPFLFGRGPYGGGAFLDRRERGTIVRATAIAQARPAVVVGPIVPNVSHGLANFWVERDSWAAASGTVTVTLDGSGTFAAGLAGGFVTDADAARPCVLGASLTNRGSDSAIVANDRFVPIYASISGTARVVAFGLVDVTAASPTTMEIRTRTDALAPRNATSSFVRSPFGPDVSPEITVADFTTVMSEFQTLGDNPNVLRAPASARAID